MSELDLRAVNEAVKEAEHLLADWEPMRTETLATRICIAYEKARTFPVSPSPLPDEGEHAAMLAACDRWSKRTTSADPHVRQASNCERNGFFKGWEEARAHFAAVPVPVPDEPDPLPHERTRPWPFSDEQAVERGASIKLPGSGFRRFPREEVERMRQELLGSYAPETLMPDAKSNVNGHVVDGDPEAAEDSHREKANP